MKDTKIKLVDGIFGCSEDAHIRVDTSNGNGEHAVEIRLRENDKSDQITQREDPSEKTCLDGTSNKSVENCVRLVETGSRTGKDDDQRD